MIKRLPSRRGDESSEPLMATGGVQKAGVKLEMA
jgi:hypothetical protein